MYLGKENRYLRAIQQGSIAIHSLSMHQLLKGQLAELPIILESFSLAQPITQALLYGWRVEVVRSHKVAGKGYSKTENSQIVFIGAIFNSTYHTKQLNPWPNSPANCVMIYSWPYACPGKMKPFKDHPSTHACLTSLRSKQQQKQPRKLLALLLFDGEKRVLLLCAYIEAAFLKSRHYHVPLFKNQQLGMGDTSTKISIPILYVLNTQAPSTFS